MQSSTGDQPHFFKNHPLEGDGFLLNLYHYLWKKDKNLESCEGVLFPHTIVYEHNFPRGWYSTEPKSRELKKRTGRDLDTRTINIDFLDDVAPNDPNEIVASYLSRRRTRRGGRDVVYVEFFNQQMFEEFLWKRGKKGEGVLQQFVVPKGSLVDRKNSVIQAIWSPHVFTVERRTNFLKLGDTRYGLYEKCVTYEGPAHYSTEFFCAPQLARRIKTICQSIVTHFLATEHKSISRMVLYFKMDNDNNVWLLWGSSLRVQSPHHRTNSIRPMLTSTSSEDGDPSAGTTDPSSSQTKSGTRHLSAAPQALNLSPQFISVAASSRTENDDVVASVLGGRSGSGTLSSSSSSSGGSRPASGTVEVFRCPSCVCTRKRKVAVTVESIVRRFRAEKEAEAEERRKRAAEEEEARATARAAREETSSSSSSSSRPGSRSSSSSISGRSGSNLGSGVLSNEDQELVLEQLDDLLYEVYSHFLVVNDEPFLFALPPKLPPLISSKLTAHFTKLGILPWVGELPEFVPPPAVPVVPMTPSRMTSSSASTAVFEEEDLGPVLASSADSGGLKFLFPSSSISQARFQREIESVKLLLTSGGAAQLKHQGSFGGGIDMLWKQNADDLESRTDDVPPALLVLFPDLTNASYVQRCKDPLFLTKQVFVCEGCLCKFDAVRAATRRTTSRRRRRRRRRTRGGGRSMAQTSRRRNTRRRAAAASDVISATLPLPSSTSASLSRAEVSSTRPESSHSVRTTGVEEEYEAEVGSLEAEGEEQEQSELLAVGTEGVEDDPDDPDRGDDVLDGGGEGEYFEEGGEGEEEYYEEDGEGEEEYYEEGEFEEYAGEGEEFEEMGGEEEADGEVEDDANADAEGGEAEE